MTAVALQPYVRGIPANDYLGDDDLYDFLDAGFVLQDIETAALNKDHRTFSGLYDKWSVWIKKCVSNKRRFQTRL